MTQITEDYVSFETAKRLSTKGFKGEFHKHYWGYEPGKEFLTDGYFNPEYDYPAPTLQMAMKWLREVHNIQVVVSPYNTLDKTWSYHMFRNFEALTQRFYIFKTYEESCEAAIKYCLENLI